VGKRTRGDTTPVPLVASEFTELHPAVSPDGRWLAYASNESGANEVYVRPFPGTAGGRWQVSTGGGEQPRWAPGGRELFYLDGRNRLVAAAVRTAPSFEVTGLDPLFDIGDVAIDAFHQSYDVVPGGGFVFLRPQRTAEAAATVPLVHAENWFADVRARASR
jgi:hypothetical protein